MKVAVDVKTTEIKMEILKILFIAIAFVIILSPLWCEGMWELLFVLYKNFKQKSKQFNLQTMNIKYLFQALRFACLPTLSVLTILFFAFFDIGKTIGFISSDHGFAITLRIILVIGEIALVIAMYFKYQHEGELENSIKGNKSKTYIEVDYNTYVKNLNNEWDSSNIYRRYLTGDPNIVVIERKLKPLI